VNARPHRNAPRQSTCGIPVPGLAIHPSAGFMTPASGDRSDRLPRRVIRVSLPQNKLEFGQNVTDFARYIPESASDACLVTTCAQTGCHLVTRTCRIILAILSRVPRALLIVRTGDEVTTSARYIPVRGYSLGVDGRGSRTFPTVCGCTLNLPSVDSLLSLHILC
jgi:hypothetical protein